MRAQIVGQIALELGDAVAGLLIDQSVGHFAGEAPLIQLLLYTVGDALGIVGLAEVHQIISVVQLVLGVRIGHAGFLQTVVALEGGHSLLAVQTVDAIGRVVQIAQLNQPVLQGNDVGGIIAVHIAALQQAVTAGDSFFLLAVLLSVLCGNIHSRQIIRGGHFRQGHGKLHANQGKNQQHAQKSTKHSTHLLLFI